MTGRKFGALLVLGLSHQDNYKRWHYLCICKCGRTAAYAKNNLVRSRRNCTSCTDLSKNATHGLRGAPEYGIWVGMKQRCQNSRCRNFLNYGRKGITVSEAWQVFENFYRDMGPRPSSAHQIDRIDNTSGYSKENCRWADRETNQTNRTDSYWWIINGIKFSSGAEAGRHFGVTGTQVGRWVYGYTDKRRGTTKPPRPDCYIVKKYDHS